MVKILAFAGSGRKDSVNKKVVQVAAQGAKEAGAEVTFVELESFDMPIFTEDLEAEKGMHAGGQQFKELLMSHDGFLIASPEYNSSYSALFKNAIDWASRKVGDEKPLQAYKGKVAGIMAASPGALGGMRVLVTLRMLMENLGTLVLPTQKAVGNAFSLFDEQGNCTDEKTEKALKAIGRQVAETCQKLKD
ncbi:NAD(P)H-dependent oxidoreductase [Aestuariibacter halophilus]|uniref:NAD(P)H-dependent oxidoreductase n=1 Tax=Fluctibacter halophilus TaxID=226011 RepID=A0ABS8G819_9ALTE|nr:NAD(P)H-dependent oxidoreductase [Aestuariibacter halophilus]MCC2616727.1 NAD(P)H-dependent oxidoreductase [Aestuariibacter halophilus]